MRAVTTTALLVVAMGVAGHAIPESFGSGNQASATTLVVDPLHAFRGLATSVDIYDASPYETLLQWERLRDIPT